MAKLYVIRKRDGSSSEPLGVDEVKNRILKGRYDGSELASLHPGSFSMQLREIPEFQKEFSSRHEDRDSEATRLHSTAGARGDSEKTRVVLASDVQRAASAEPAVLPPPEEILPVSSEDFDPELADEPTREIERPAALLEKDPLRDRKKKSILPKKSFLLLALLSIFAYEYAFEDDEELEGKARRKIKLTPVRAMLPPATTGAPNPILSGKLYQAGLRLYLQDQVKGYRGAAEMFQKAVAADSGNVRAIAMLASTYINLIESSNKDENTYSVINKLIQLSGMKQLDLLETLLSEVEFLAIQRRYDSGIQKLVDYFKLNGKFDPLLYYYVAWLYAQKSEYSKAMNYLNQIPASALRMARLYHLRGWIHEQSEEYGEAVTEYQRALQLSSQHARSILGLIRIAEKTGDLRKRAKEVLFLSQNPSLQSPQEYVDSLVYRAKLALVEKQPAAAVWPLETALEVEPLNEKVRLEYYTLMAALGQEDRYKKLAQMYALVLQADRDLKEGKLHEAKTVLLSAQDTFPKSSVPFEKMGDLFYQTGEFLRAQYNYKKGLGLQADSTSLSVKLVDTYIRNQEWDEAQALLIRLKDHPRLKSAVDRLWGDLAYHRADYAAAAGFYRKAMSQDTIDTEVYSAYANLMRMADQCTDAQFFFSLAQRLDPLSVNAISGSAKCLLKTDGVDAAVARIQEELVRLPKARVEFVSAIAEIYLLANDDEKALKFADQAKAIDPDHPEAYRVEGMVYLRQMISKKDAKPKALDALKSYSDRKPSDPMGYLERFEIFLKDSDFEKAEAELERVFEVSPRYPQLHYKRALMYARMGRSKDALAELEAEIKISPRYDPAWVEQGELLLQQNRIEDSLKSFAKAMELNPKNPKAKTGAGYANYLKRQYSMAIALFESALSLDRGNPEIYKKIGMAYRESGDGVKAAQAFRSYLDLAPDAADRAEFEKYLR